MPKQLALLLCSSFVIYMLRYTRAERNKVSGALWIPIIWIFSIGTKPIDTWLGTHAGEATYDPMLQCILLGIGLMIINKRRMNWSLVIRENLWLVLLVGFMFLSMAWSDIVFTAFKRWIRELTGVVMALVVLTEPDPRRAMEISLRRTVYVLIPFSILVIKYFPDLGVLYSRWTGDIQWVGVTLQKNGLGRLCVISAFFLIWTFIRRWNKADIAVGKYQTFFEIVLFLITFWLFKGPSLWASSATALYALSCGLLTLTALRWMKKRHTKLGANTWVAIVASIIVFGTITVFVGGSTVTSFTSAVGRDSTLTGRTEIWSGLIPDVQSAPLLGVGFGSFWTPIRIARHDIGEAHNGYLEIWLGLGFVGLFLTAGFLLSSTRKAAIALSQDYDWGSLCICFLLMTAVHNITESSFDSFTRHLMAVLLFLAVATLTNIPKQRTAETIAATDRILAHVGA